jgi:hypothetical protein
VTPDDLTELLLRDALARAIRISEFVADGEIREAALALDDLVADLWKAVRLAA